MSQSLSSTPFSIVLMVPVGFGIWDHLIPWSENGMTCIVSVLFGFSSLIRSTLRRFFLSVNPGRVMGLKDSPIQIQEPLWIFPQPLTMTFPAIQVRSGKWDVYLDEPFFSIGTCFKGSTFPGGWLDPG